jgi:hypothetical protein
MAWTTLTTDEVLQEFTQHEQSALAQIKGGSSDALAGILDRVVSEFRGAIRAGGHTLGDEGTLPDSLRGHAVAVARWRYLTSIGKAEALQTDARKAANTRAETILDKLALQELPVEPPDGGTYKRTGNWNSHNPLLPRSYPIPRAGTQGDNSADRGPNDDAPPLAT